MGIQWLLRKIVFFLNYECDVICSSRLLLPEAPCNPALVIGVAESHRNQKTSSSFWKEAKTIHWPEAPAEDRVLGLASRQEVRVRRRVGQESGLPLHKRFRSVRSNAGATTSAGMQKISFSK